MPAIGSKYSKILLRKGFCFRVVLWSSDGIQLKKLSGFVMLNEVNRFDLLFSSSINYVFSYRDPRVRAEACMAFEQFLDPNIIHDIVYGRVKLPSFVEFVNHVSYGFRNSRSTVVYRF